jgi:hypothetical protein
MPDDDKRGGPGGAHSLTPSDWAEATRLADEFAAGMRADHKARVEARAATKKAARQAGMESGAVGPPNPLLYRKGRPKFKRDW